MPLKIIQKEIEAEREIGYKYLQFQARAEALVPGAGREAIDVLLWDANAVIVRADVQNDRVVLDGTLSCQAVYRQGEETSLRALSAKSALSQVTEIPGAQGGMLPRILPVVESVEARYENGHIIFLASMGVHVRVLKLEPVGVIHSVEDAQNLQLRFQEICLTRLAAEAAETAVLTEQVELPQALDARASLMDWGSVTVESCRADLGGVRIKGRVQAETLIASGIEGRPAVLVKYPIEFDKLIEVPEWLSQSACVSPSLRSIRSQLEPAGEDDEAILLLQADVHFAIASNLHECTSALVDAYAVAGNSVNVQQKRMTFCREAGCLHAQEIIRGTVLLEEGAPAAGSVIAVRALPNIAEIVPIAGGSRISGLLEASVLYMPGGSDIPASAHTQLPFELDLDWELGENPSVGLSVVSAEANALMSDRLEMKIILNVDSEVRLRQEYVMAEQITEGETVERRPGYIICWPETGEDGWSIAKRYGVPEVCVPADRIAANQPVVLRI